MELELVIFDNDGVLVASEHLANRILSELLTEAGIPTTPEESVRRYLGTSLPQVREIVEAGTGRPLPDDFEDAYHRRLFRLFETELAAVEGVREVVERVRAAGIPTCVASSGSRERIRRSLGAVGLWPLFAGAVFSAEDSEVGRGKPAPDLFLHAAREMGADPSRTAVVEDSPRGVEAANAAGAISFGYAGRTPPEKLDAATGGTFERMEALPAMLGV